MTHHFIHHITILLAALAFVTSANAQVVSSINEQNMKNAEKQQVAIKKKTAAEKLSNAKIDTTTVYYCLLDSAQRHIKNKDWSKAETFIRQAIQSEPANPSNSLLISNLATLQRYQGKYADAVKNYTMAIDMTPNAVTLLKNRAALYLEIDSIALAKSDYERIIKAAPDDEESRYNLGMIYLDTKSYKAADEQFEEILRYNPNSALSSKGKAFSCKAQGNFAKAAQYFSDIIKADPSSSLLANRADCYLMTKRIGDAADDINSAIQLDPDNGYLYLLRAKLNKMRYESDASKRDIQLAIEHGVDKAEAEAALK